MDAISIIVDALSTGRNSKKDRGRKVKAILVFSEMPNSCDECEVTCTGYTAKEYTQKGIKRPVWCPIRPVPQKREPKKEWLNEYHRDEFTDGWNACVNEITGETE